MTRTLTLLVLLWLCPMATAQDDFQLPAEDDVVILSMDYVGGERLPPPPDFVRQPYLQIFADGRVLHSTHTPQIEATEYTLSHEQLNDFLSLVVNDHKFYELDGAKIKQEFKDAGHNMLIADAPTLKLKLSLGIGEHSTSCYGLHYIKRVMPDNEAVSNLDKIVELCRKQVSLAAIGGTKSVPAYLEKVNAKLKTKEQEPFELSDFNRASRYADRTVVTFSKTVDAPTGENADQKAKITVTLSVRDNGDESSKYTRTPIKKRRGTGAK